MTKPDLMAELAEVPCSDCGMPCKLDEYHPFAACLMFKACHNSEVVRANLFFVVESGKAAHHAELEAAVRDAESWRQLLAEVGAEQLVLASKKHGDALSILRDAERYRWLRERNALLSDDGEEPPFNFCVSDDQGDGEIHWVGSDLDGAIDAAMVGPAMHNSAREG